VNRHTPVAWHALFLGLVPSSGEPAAANPKHSKILSRQCKLASGKLNFLAVAEYPRSKMLKGYLTQLVKGLHIILSPLRLQFWSKLACLTMRNTTFENFPIAITLTIPTYNTHALQLQNPIVTTQQLHHRSNQGICMSWHIILIYIYIYIQERITQARNVRSVHAGCEVGGLSLLAWKHWKGLCRLQVGGAATQPISNCNLHD